MSIFYIQIENNKGVVSRKFTRIALLFSRIILFAIFQSIIALFCKSWSKSEKYWMLTATLGNVISIYLLTVLFKSEGKNYLPIFRFDKLNWKS